MARTYRRYRNYNRRNRARWAPNIQEIGTTTIGANASDSFFYSFTLAFNPTQINTAVSQVYTVKNIEISYYIDTTGNATTNGLIEDVTGYIMYVPQGMNVTADYNVQHPEYILGYKFLGGPSNDGAQPYQPSRIRSRLSRKLQSGDSIILFIKGNNVGTTSSSFDFHGLVRWWTKAN